MANIPTNRFGIWLILVDLIISIAGLILFSGPGGVGVYLLSLGLHRFTLTFPGVFGDWTHPFIPGICVAQLLLVGLMLKLAALKE